MDNNFLDKSNNTKHSPNNKIGEFLNNIKNRFSKSINNSKKDKDILEKYHYAINNGAVSDDSSLTLNARLKNLKNKWRPSNVLNTNLIKNEITTFIDWNKNYKIIAINLF